MCSLPHGHDSPQERGIISPSVGTNNRPFRERPDQPRIGTVKTNRLILLTNDDGVEALGIRCLAEALGNLGRVVVAAPDRERSASSHGLTIHDPIRIREVSPDRWSVTGTPVDCVMLGIRQILSHPPDLVVSGINHGPNLGDDLIYSGTVAAAREAAICGLPGVAVSLMSRRKEAFAPAATYAANLIEELIPGRVPPGSYLNINLPNENPAGFRFTRQGSKRVAGVIEEKTDPRGRSYFWIGLDQSEWRVEADTDYEAIREGFASVTPLQRDQTDYRHLQLLCRSQADPAGSVSDRQTRE